MKSEIKGNTFENNKILPLLQQTQTQKQASCLYIIGGTNVISGNVFKNHRQEVTDMIKLSAPKILEYVP